MNDAITLRHVLQGHRDVIQRIVWSRDGSMLASPSVDSTLKLWDAREGELLRTLEGHSYGVNHAAWSPDGGTIVTASFDHTIRVWNVADGACVHDIEAHLDDVSSVAWSPDGGVVASGSADYTVRLWNPATWASRAISTKSVRRVLWSPAAGAPRLAVCQSNGVEILSGEGWPDSSTLLGRERLRAQRAAVLSACWSTDGGTMASAGRGRVIWIWDAVTAQCTVQLEGHTGDITDVSFSADGRLLASKAMDGSVRLWSTRTWKCVAAIEEPNSNFWTPGLAFHPSQPVLATLGERDSVIRIWEIEVEKLLRSEQTVRSTLYSNAKVVLVGESGVGKTGLALAMLGRFAPSDSTHARNVWVFEEQQRHLDQETEVISETLLWDMAGQPGYRLLHQINLTETAVALIVIDARSETDPFAGVAYWARALRQASALGTGEAPVKIFLVAARADRGGVAASQARIQNLVEEFGFEGYFQTSAKEGWGISELSAAVRAGVDWKSMPRVSSSALFDEIRKFLIEETQAERFITNLDSLYVSFLLRTLHADTSALRDQFGTGIRLLESRGLVRRLSFGKLVLLRPELLDSYAWFVLNAAKEEPEGLGYISETAVTTASFRMPAAERIGDREAEGLVLRAALEDLIRFEIGFREDSDRGPFLVFPSQFTRDWPEAPNPPGATLTFTFDGPLQNIYTTLAVRLARSGFFHKADLWKNAISFEASVGGICGLWIHEIQEGRGDITLYFGETASEETRYHFEEYVRAHLDQRALPGSVTRRRMYVCPRAECGAKMAPEHVDARRRAGFREMLCPVCELARISLADREDRLPARPKSVLPQMTKMADQARDRVTSEMVRDSKESLNEYDVFLCHNSVDKPFVRRVCQRLEERSIRAWLDERDLRPGVPWIPVIEQMIETVRAVAVFVGGAGMGPWQEIEQQAFVMAMIERGLPVIPVVMPGPEGRPKLPTFLATFGWVDFRGDETTALEQLIWGVKGEKPQRLV